MSTSNLINQIISEIQNEDQVKHIEKTAVNIGKVVSVKDEVILASGLDHVGFGEMVDFQNGSTGMVIDLAEELVGIIVFGNYEFIKEGDLITASGKVFSVGVGEEVLGRILDGVGNVIDGGRKFSTDEQILVDSVAAGVIERKSVDTPLQTGIKAIDALVPIGRGQRELIIGDRRTGKTTLAVDTIINQKSENVICIYNFIGAKNSTIAQVVEKLRKAKALSYSVIVAASSSDSSAMQFISPYVATAIGEYFMKKGKDVLVVYDDLSKHAWAYRQVSLVLRRPSGREAYPGDVFYLHSRLLERSCKLEKGGSITSLPIIETLEGDVSAYIPTNVISITDGQIFLESEMFNAGLRPAISVGLSVSRVGGAAQTKAMKSVAGKLKLDLAQFRELAAFAQFEGDLDANTKAFIDRGARMTQLLVQPANSPYSLAEQVVVFFAAKEGMFDQKAVDMIRKTELDYLTFIKSNYPQILKSIDSKKILDENDTELLQKAIKSFSSL